MGAPTHAAAPIEAQFGGEAAKAAVAEAERVLGPELLAGREFHGTDRGGRPVRDGVDRMMWGSDYPHYEGTFPYTREALRWPSPGIDPAEVQQIVGGNAAALYGFDLDALVPVAADVGPVGRRARRPARPGRHPRRRLL